GLSAVIKFDKGKASRLTALPIRGKVNITERANCREMFSQLGLGRIIREISNKKTDRHIPPLNNHFTIKHPVLWNLAEPFCHNGACRLRSRFSAVPISELYCRAVPPRIHLLASAPFSTGLPFICQSCVKLVGRFSSLIFLNPISRKVR